jgi:enoyl-CoA hydratase/carnithine racemase
MLPHLVGHVKAAEKLLLGETFTGVEAVRLGIANAALPAAEVLPHARHMAERFNALPDGAVRDSKRLLRAGVRQGLATAMSAEAAVFIERLKSPEAREAFQAFIEKRKPDFAKTR